MAFGLSPRNRPVSFGYKNHWLAIRDVEPRVVAEVLDLQRLRPSSWQMGIERAYLIGTSDSQDVFVSPPIHGWTLAVGGSSGIPQAGNPAWPSFLCSLSEKLGVVQYFGSHRVVGYVAWAMADHGRLVRAYGHSDERGETLFDYGSLTQEERTLGIRLLNEKTASEREVAAHSSLVDEIQARIFEFQLQHPEGAQTEAESRETEALLHQILCLVPDEDTVLLVAERWSLNPMKLGEYEVETPLGLLGSIKRRRFYPG